MKFGSIHLTVLVEVENAERVHHCLGTSAWLVTEPVSLSGSIQVAGAGDVVDPIRVAAFVDARTDQQEIPPEAGELSPATRARQTHLGVQIRAHCRGVDVAVAVDDGSLDHGHLHPSCAQPHVQGLQAPRAGGGLLRRSQIAGRSRQDRRQAVLDDSVFVDDDDIGCMQAAGDASHQHRPMKADEKNGAIRDAAGAGQKHLFKTRSAHCYHLSFRIISSDIRSLPSFAMKPV